MFSEHLIEHLSYAQGSKMLAECYRILKPHGKVRLSTPDLMFLFELYNGENKQLKQEYIRWAIDGQIDRCTGYYEAFVINNFVRAWGHKFIYDERVLRHSLETAGFTEITRRPLRESDDEELRNLENESRMPEGFLRLETIVLEATKP